MEYIEKLLFLAFLVCVVIFLYVTEIEPNLPHKVEEPTEQQQNFLDYKKDWLEKNR